MKRLASGLSAQLQHWMMTRRIWGQVAGLVLVLSLVQTASGGFDSDAVGFGHRLVLWIVIIAGIAIQFLALTALLRRVLPASFAKRQAWTGAFLCVWPLAALEVEGLKRTPLLSYQPPDPLFDFMIFMLPGVAFLCGLIILIAWLDDRRLAREKARSTPPPLEPGDAATGLPATPVMSVEAQDHYLEIVTESRTHLVRATMREALSRLDPARGMQVHRSWWVAQEAVVRAERRGRDHVLILRDGRVAPIARGRTERLKDAGWL